MVSSSFTYYTETEVFFKHTLIISEYSLESVMGYVGPEILESMRNPTLARFPVEKKNNKKEEGRRGREEETLDTSERLLLLSSSQI